MYGRVLMIHHLLTKQLNEDIMKNYSNIQKGVVGSMLALTLLTAGVPPSYAAANTSIADLQAQITQLLAQLEALRNTSSPTTCTPFTTDLTIGRTGSDVTRLQQLLLQKGHTIPAGATGFFGEQTRQALASYQRTQILVISQLILHLVAKHHSVILILPAEMIQALKLATQSELLQKLSLL
jgi:hypothetical protein